MATPLLEPGEACCFCRALHNTGWMDIRHDLNSDNFGCRGIAEGRLPIHNTIARRGPPPPCTPASLTPHEGANHHKRKRDNAHHLPPLPSDTPMAPETLPPPLTTLPTTAATTPPHHATIAASPPSSHLTSTTSQPSQSPSAHPPPAMAAMPTPPRDALSRTPVDSPPHDAARDTLLVASPPPTSHHGLPPHTPNDWPIRASQETEATEHACEALTEEIRKLVECDLRDHQDSLPPTFKRVVDACVDVINMRRHPKNPFFCTKE